MAEKTNTYIVKCQNVVLGTITETHAGTGWLSGRFTPFVYFERFRSFCQEYFRSAMYMNDQNKWMEEKSKLSQKYEDELFIENNWTIQDQAKKKKVSISIPLIDTTTKTITWKEYLPA